MDPDDGSATAPATCDLLDPRSLPFTSGRSRGKLPHLFKPGCTYFVTFCLERSCRVRVQAESRLDMTADPDDVARMSEPPCDSTDPALSIPRVAQVVEHALLHFQGERYALHAWCIMPDHVHVLVTPFHNWSLDRILHSWKSYTANEVNKMLHRAVALWQPESFDHLVRSPEAFERFVAYIEANPVEAGLCSNPSPWPFSSARHRGNVVG